MKSQTDRILAHLRIAPITRLQAIHWMGCINLPGRVFDLREAGFIINGRMKKVRNRRGEVCWVKEYKLISEPKS